jgi:hypothetical protein
MNKDLLLSKLWEQYMSITPSAKKIHALLEQNGEKIENDHIAIRTFNDVRVNISVVEKPFVNAGYVAKGEYFFESKKLYAKHYEHTTDANAPRIFISELELEKCSESLQNSVKVLEESEYAAWMYVYGFRANHFTINVNALSNFKNLEELNTYLKDNNWKMNGSGGEIKGTPAQLLEQSSTLADLCTINFDEGAKEIPSCYYEFALRYPMENGELYQGFIAASADKIFESTDVKLQNIS